MYQLDEDIQVRQIAGNRWRGKVTPRWNIGDAPNGGYLMAIAGGVLSKALPHPDPLTFTAHFLDKALNQEVDLEVEQLRTGRSVSTAVARFIQNDVERARFTATYTDFDQVRGPTQVAGLPPDLPPPEQCIPIGEAAPQEYELRKRLDLRLDPDCIHWGQGGVHEVNQLRGWVRLADGREPDPIALLLLVDVFPPPATMRFGHAGWVPTLELTVHLRGKPAPGYLRCKTQTRFVINGLLEEEAEIWDATGKLVAMSRQIAKLRLPGA